MEVHVNYRKCTGHLIRKHSHSANRNPLVKTDPAQKHGVTILISLEIGADNVVNLNM